MDLVAFLRARLDEDRAKITRPATMSGSRAVRDVEAKRAILAAYEMNDNDAELHLGPHPRKHGEWDGLRFAVRHLAAVWRDHPDYDPGWKP
jgi:Family of unknown function (DUF6221)